MRAATLKRFVGCRVFDEHSGTASTRLPFQPWPSGIVTEFVERSSPENAAASRFRPERY